MLRHRWLSLALLLSLGSWLVAQAAQPAPPAPASKSAAAGAAAVSGAPKTAAAGAQKTAAAGAQKTAASASSMQPVIPLTRFTLSVYWLGAAILAAVLVWLARAKGLLRDGGAGSAWSLGRSQMAWWFFVVVASFVFIWLFTGEYATLTTSVLALIGISSGTALSGAVIDDGKQPQVQEHQALQDEQAHLQQTNQQLAAAAAVAPPPGGAGAAALVNVPAMQANFARLDTIAGKLAQLPAKQTTKDSFWLDILSDENGISFHRLQIVVWTVVLTVIFIYRVHADRAMPDFDPQLLGLMGISSGTYIGFKFPEKQA